MRLYNEYEKLLNVKNSVLSVPPLKSLNIFSFQKCKLEDF